MKRAAQRTTTRTTTTTTTTTTSHSTTVTRKSSSRLAKTAAAAPPNNLIDLLEDDDDDDDENLNVKPPALPQHQAPAAVDVDVPEDDGDVVVVLESPRKRPRSAVAAAAAVAPKDSPAFFSVRDVFPDANPDRIRQVLQQNDQNVEVAVALLLQEPLELKPGGHSQEQPVDLLDDTDDHVKPASAAVTTLRWGRSASSSSHDFMRKDSFVAADDYLAESQALLLHHFPFLSKDGAKRLLSERRHYAIAHEAIWSAITTMQVASKAASPAGAPEMDEQFHAVEQVLAGRPLSQAQEKAMTALTPTGKNYVKRPRKPPPKTAAPVAATAPPISNDILLEERAFVQKKVDEWMATASKYVKRRENQAKAQENNSAVECSCCFDSFSLDDMCSCRDEGHLFCTDCLENFCHAQVFGSGNLGAADKDSKRPAMQLSCFYADGCKSGFSRAILEKALTRRTLEKYDELQFQIAVQAAALPDLVACPQCSFQFQLENNAVQKLHCPMEGCRFESCRECRLAWHEKMTCEEAKQREHSRAGRHKVEEAMTLAKVRCCPKCSKAFLKESGCNKITCSFCNTLSCYICRKTISSSEGYAHFCQAPHCQLTAPPQLAARNEPRDNGSHTSFWSKGQCRPGVGWNRTCICSLKWIGVVNVQMDAFRFPHRCDGFLGAKYRHLKISSHASIEHGWGEECA